MFKSVISGFMPPSVIKKVERKLVSEIVVGPNWKLFDLERRMRPRKDSTGNVVLKFEIMNWKNLLEKNDGCREMRGTTKRPRSFFFHCWEPFKTWMRKKNVHSLHMNTNSHLKNKYVDYFKRFRTSVCLVLNCKLNNLTHCCCPACGQLVGGKQITSAFQ